MALRLEDKWLWDFWTAKDNDDYHIFYLQAPRSLEDPNLRHWNVSIGHAVSRDLVNWTLLPDALKPGPSPAWDDCTTWTGSIIRHQHLWYLFYTGSRKAENGLVQRIGLATSSDLILWEKHPANPLIAADPKWYETLDLNLWHDQAWRDPWVFHNPGKDDFHAFITARVNDGPADERGVIGHARSKDLITWQVLPPVSQPGEFGHLEVPQLLTIGKQHILLFCVPHNNYSNARKDRIDNPVSGTHYLVSKKMLGPFKLTTDKFLVGDEIGSLYAGKMVPGPDGNLQFLATRQFAPNGLFIGELSDPLPVNIHAAGELSVIR